MAGNVLVFAERRDGEIKRPALESIATGRRLADALGGELEVLALGPGASAAAAEVGRYGADRLRVCEVEHAALYAPELYAASVAEAARAIDAAVVLVASTSMGRDLAPRVAARLQTGSASDLVEIEIADGGALTGRRPVYSGKAYARVSIPEAKPAVATLRPNAFPATVASSPRDPAVVTIDSPLDEGSLRVRTVRVGKAEQQELDVSEASIVVSGGRGLKGPEHFGLLRELASELGGAVGASRAVVDEGWIGHAHQVGQTGKVVSPNLYIACGISGAVQHLAGMSTSKTVVAINKDADAPIFKIASYGIVGDLFEVVPALTEAVRKLKTG